MRRLPWMWIAIALLVVAVAGGGLFWVSQSQLLAIDQIEVDGNSRVTTDQVLERVGPLLTGQSLLSRSFDNIAQLVSAFPYVESVDIERSFPHTIRLHVHEYRPAAQLATPQGNVWVLAADGRVLDGPVPIDNKSTIISTKETCPAEAGSVPDCPEAAMALEFLANIPMEFNYTFAAVSVAGEDLTARTTGNVSVHFGNLDQYGLKFEVLKQLMSRQGGPGQELTVDVSVPDRPVTR